MHQTAVIGIDLGTTGCRASIHFPDGRLAASCATEYPLYTPSSDWAEQQPQEIWQAFISVVQGAINRSNLTINTIAGICFSVAFHSLLAIDSKGEPLCPIMTWADNRSQAEVAALKTTTDSSLYHRTGCPLHPMYPLAKIIWLRQHRPDIFNRAVKFISLKEYLIYRLTGQFIVDYSMASGTGLMNLANLDWDQQALNLAGITAEHLSPLAPTSHIITGIHAAVTKNLGLAANTAIVLGAGDGAMANLGSGVIRPGQLAATVGTSGAVRMLVTQPQTDPNGCTWCYNVNDSYWMAGAAISNGGISLRWVRDQIAAHLKHQATTIKRDSYELLIETAASSPAGAKGLLFLPLLSGERAPHWNADARGVFFGLSLQHQTPHLIRATLEGVMFRMFSIMSLLETVAQPADQIRISGSFSQSPLWIQIMADIFGRPILAPGQPEGAAFGASAFGMTALGLLPTIAAIADITAPPTTYYPDVDKHQLYQELYTIYCRVYQNLQAEFQAISAIQRRY